jgi:chitodextrinase
LPKTPGFTKPWASLVSKGDSAWSLTRYDSTNNADFNSFSPSADDLRGTINIADNQWHHLAIVYNGSVKQLYTDGQLNVSKNFTQKFSTNNFPIRIGHNAEFASAYFNGLLDEVRIYNRALSGQEILDIYNDTGAPAPPDTAAPSVPANLSATAVSTAQINLSWTASTDNVGVSGYRVYRDGSQVAISAQASFADTGLAASTTYTYAMAAFDAAGNVSALSSSVSVTTPSPSPGDTIAPSVAITAPAANALVSGTAVTIAASASDNVGVVGVQFRLDGGNLGAEDTTPPYAISWNTTQTASGSHTLSAVARDAAGNVGQSAAVSVIVDNQPPTGTIAINNNAAATNSRNVVLSLTASDAHTSVTHMRFSNTGSAYSTAETFAPSKAWQLSSGSGTKTVYVQFKDATGNWSPAVTDTIILDTAKPTLSSIRATAITANAAAITWTSNEPSTSRVEYGLTTSYSQTTPLDTVLVTAHAVSLSNLTASTTYYYRVRSIDAAGNEAISANQTFQTVAVPDTTPSRFPLTAPERQCCKWHDCRQRNGN